MSNMIETQGVYIHEDGRIVKHCHSHEMSEGVMHENLARAIKRYEQLGDAITNMRKLLLDHYSGATDERQTTLFEDDEGHDTQGQAGTPGRRRARA